MILSKEQYDQMIDDDPFPWYKYSRLPEEEKMLSYLTMNGSEHENLTAAIANLGPQPFRGTYGTNFQPPGFERGFCQYDNHVNDILPGPVPPPGLLPLGLRPLGVRHHSVYVPGFACPSGSHPSSRSLQDLSLPGPSDRGRSHANRVHFRDYPQLYNGPMQSCHLASHDPSDGKVEPGKGKAPLIQCVPWESPVCRPLIVGGNSSDDDDECEKLSRVPNLPRKPPSYCPLVVGLSSDDEYDDTVDRGFGKLSSPKRRSRKGPASGPLVVGGDSSDGDDDDYAYYGGDEVEYSKQSGLDRKRSTSSVMSTETVDVTSGRVSLTSSQTTPPKASCS